MAANCSPYATCNYDEVRQSHECKCMPGFKGDGHTCVGPTCVLGVCWCSDGRQFVDGVCKSDQAPESPQGSYLMLKIIKSNGRHEKNCPISEREEEEVTNLENCS